MPLTVAVDIYDEYEDESGEVPAWGCIPDAIVERAAWEAQAYIDVVPNAERWRAECESIGAIDQDLLDLDLIKKWLAVQDQARRIVEAVTSVYVPKGLLHIHLDYFENAAR